ncbi:MAG: hypothetical protein J6V03_02205 [Clostridia bacterium]|nr:hypothetical protein [Clostridia bacterium]
MASFVRAFSALCQQCNKRFQIAERFCTTINLDIEGFEKEKFEDGSLNRIVCPYCNTEFTFEISMIVFSQNMKIACIVDQNIDTKEITSLKSPPYILFPEDFTYRCVRYIDEAREKLRIIKHGCDDFIIEYIKLMCFKDEDALPFNEVSLVFDSKEGEAYKFSKLNFNGEVLENYDIVFKDSDIPEAVKNMKYSQKGKKWHKLDRISLKEEIKNAKI